MAIEIWNLNSIQTKTEQPYISAIHIDEIEHLTSLSFYINIFDGVKTSTFEFSKTQQKILFASSVRNVSLYVRPRAVSCLTNANVEFTIPYT